MAFPVTPLRRAAARTLAVSIALAALQSSAQAQPRTRMLVVFDSSGSMTWAPRRSIQCAADADCPPGNQCDLGDRLCEPFTFGDGSREHPGIDYDGDGQANDSRLYIAKQALRSTIQSVEAIELGLMRYHQSEGAGIRATCECEGCPRGGSFTWYDQPPYECGEGEINYDGSQACAMGGELLVPIGPQTRGEILSWVDNEESDPFDPAGDRELRADGPTPLAGALLSAALHFEPAALPGAPAEACGGDYVLLLTDGEETCDGDPVGAATLLRALNVRTFVLGLGENTAGSNTLHAIARAGGTERAHFADDLAGLQEALGEIVRQALPREICNGVDDDCDGVIDEDTTVICEDACGGLQEQRCVDGVLEACPDPGPIEPEICDGIDNDCDQRIDEQAPCQGDHACRYGECARPCVEGDCPGDLECQEGYCVDDPCGDVSCPGGEVCELGVCVDLACLGVRCAIGSICSRGVCTADDCYLNGCPDAGETCLDGRCQVDLCAEHACGPAELCHLGACVLSCAGVECPAGQSCFEGACADDPCAGVACDPGTTCVRGICLEDRCAGIRCPVGRRCVEGACAHDPCVNIVCPGDQVCSGVQCVAGGAGAGDRGEQGGPAQGDFASFDGGVSAPTEDDTSAACSASGAAGSAWLLLLGLLPLLGRRQRSA